MTDLVVAEFGSASAADFDATNHSIDMMLSDANARIIVLSASAGVTNILVVLAEGLEPAERFSQLDVLRQTQFNILERLRYPSMVRGETECLLESITTLAKAAALASSTALTDELVSHSGLMSTLLFVEILRERGIQAQWFDTRKVLHANDRLGRAESDTAAVAKLTQQQPTPHLVEGLVMTQGFIGSEAKGRTTTLGRGGSDHTAALLGGALNITYVDIQTDVPGIHATDPCMASAAKRIDVIALEEAAEMTTFDVKVLYPVILLPAVRSDIPVFVGSNEEPRADSTLVCKTTENPPSFRVLTLRRRQMLLTLYSLNMLYSRGFLAEVSSVLAYRNILADSITAPEVSMVLTMDTTGSTSTGDTLSTQALLTELPSLYRVEVEEDPALVALIGSESLKAYGVGKEVFGVLEPFDIRMICCGTSNHNLCFLMPGINAEKVVQKLHHNLPE